MRTYSIAFFKVSNYVRNKDYKKQSMKCWTKIKIKAKTMGVIFQRFQRHYSLGVRTLISYVKCGVSNTPFAIIFLTISLFFSLFIKGTKKRIKKLVSTSLLFTKHVIKRKI